MDAIAADNDKPIRIFYQALTTVALLSCGFLEVHHSLLQRLAWDGFGRRAEMISYVQVPLWFLAIVGLWTNRSLSKPALILGILLLAAEGIVLCLTGNNLSYGLPYMGIAIVAASSAALAHSEIYNGSSPAVSAVPEAEAPALKLVS